jgi:hypothetical protein
MKTKLLSLIFFSLFIVGQILSLSSFPSRFLLGIYAISLSAASLIPVIFRITYAPSKFLSCHTAVMIAPVWFLYLEAIFDSGDALQLPASSVLEALSYSSFFLFIFNLLYKRRKLSLFSRLNNKLLEKNIPPSMLALIAIVLTLFILFAVFAINNFNFQQVFDLYAGGRSTGSGGIIKRSGLGGLEVFLQPISYLAPVVPTLAALSLVRFNTKTRTPIILKILCILCGILISFMIFLQGSRGNLAEFLAGPILIWLFFGRKLQPVVFISVSLMIFLSVIGIWQYQVNTRSNLLDSLGEFSSLSSVDITKTHRDNNLYLFTLDVMYRPSLYPFDGYGELAYLAVNPIPRAIWPNKPKGIQESESSFKIVTGPYSEGPIKMGTASLSCTVVCDGFKMNHVFGIAVYALIFSYIASLWDSLSANKKLNYPLYFMAACSYFFWFAWGFRSGFAFVTAMYTVWGVYLFAFLANYFNRLKF